MKVADSLAQKACVKLSRTARMKVAECLGQPHPSKACVKLVSTTLKSQGNQNEIRVNAQRAATGLNFKS